MQGINDLIKGQGYLGRGIIVGISPNGKYLVEAYFIMGRSENSQNRVFSLKGKNLYTEVLDESKCVDPSLIVYRAVADFHNKKTIITNGVQTDTIYENLEIGRSFIDALRLCREEPDEPNYTPRISALIHHDTSDISYQIGICKTNTKGKTTDRQYFEYDKVEGIGHLIHTYSGEEEGVLLPFVGEPKTILMGDDIEEFTNELWNSLNKDYKISLFVRYKEIERDNKYKELVINKYPEE